MAKSWRHSAQNTKRLSHYLLKASLRHCYLTIISTFGLYLTPLSNFPLWTGTKVTSDCWCRLGSRVAFAFSSSAFNGSPSNTFSTRHRTLRNNKGRKCYRKVLFAYPRYPLEFLKLLLYVLRVSISNCLSEETIVLPSPSQQCRNSNLGHIGDTVRCGLSNGKGKSRLKWWQATALTPAAFLLCRVLLINERHCKKLIGPTRSGAILTHLTQPPSFPHRTLSHVTHVVHVRFSSVIAS